MFKTILREISQELSTKHIRGVAFHQYGFSDIGVINDIDLPIIDLYPATKGKKNLVIPNDGHPNRNGHNIIAGELIKALKKHRLLPVGVELISH
ncbi:MAG: hypothetical protein ACYSTS_02625 [Planctomycetota bacterium]